MSIGMRKTVIGLIAAGSLGLAWAEGNGQQEQFRDQPQAGAYLSYGFGGVSLRNAPAPLHYGLKLDHDRRLRDAPPWTPPLFQLDFDTRGETLASFNGIPFAGRNLRLNQDDSGGTASTTGGGESKGGFTFFDWTLLAVGVGGAGYLIAEATKGHDSPDPPPTSGSSGGSGGPGGTCILGICIPFAGSSQGRFDDEERPNPASVEWLDGGTGQMGDLHR